MKAFLRLVGEVCAVGKLSVQALSGIYRIVGTARKGSPMMPACRRQECERLVMSALVSFAYRSFVLFCNGIRMTCEVKPVSGTRCIQKSTEKTTCNSRVTGKWGLRRFKGIFWCFFTAKICIKKCWKFRYRYLFSSQNGAYEPIRIVRPLRGLKPYTVYLITLKILFCVCLAHARQSSSPEAAHGVALSTDSIKPLQIGDTIPEALWHMPLQTVKAGRAGSTTITLNDYRGKLIILDFWATWCTACVAAMPRVDSVSEQFKKEVVVLPVTYEREDKLLPFLKSNQIVNELKLTTVYRDSILNTYFAHKLIPHYVWIYKNNFYTATRANDISETNIRQLLSSGEIHAQQKVDILDFNAQIPLLCNVSEKEFAVKGFNNVSFCNEIEGLGSKEGVSKLNNLTRRYFINRPLKELYRRALNSPHERLVFELPGQPFTGESLFCYEQVTAGDVVAQNEAMLVDLNNRLGLCQRKKRLYNSMLRKTEPVIIISAKPKRN